MMGGKFVNDERSDASSMVDTTDASSEAVMGDEADEFKARSSPLLQPREEEENTVRKGDVPISEVVVLLESSPTTKRTKNASLQLEDAEERVKFLTDKLDTTDDLVEAIFKELREEQEKAYDLNMENEELRRVVESFNNKEASTTADMDLVTQQCMLLKYGICIGIALYMCGHTGGFLITVLFLWLTLAVVPS